MSRAANSSSAVLPGPRSRSNARPTVFSYAPLIASSAVKLHPIV